MRDHEEFVELCALAAIDDLTAEQQQQLDKHAASCGECRARIREFRDLTQNWIPLADGGTRHSIHGLFLGGASRRARAAFLARARREGLGFTAAAAGDRGLWSSAPWRRCRAYAGSALATACLLILAGVVVSLLSRRPETVISSAPTSSSESAEVAALKSELIAARKSNADQAQTIATLGRDRSLAADRSQQLDQLLKTSEGEAQRLRDELARTRLTSLDAQQRLTAEVRRAEDLNTQLVSLRDARAQDQAGAIATQARIQELSEQVRLQTATLDHDRELLAANRDIRDLMSARNLHILDVHDFDLKGKAQKSFGRVFYTEGKSLIFYAYDLPTKTVKNASFQAWGQKADGSKQAINLGLLYVDDQKQARWALKFDNPEVIRQIDSVFVTIEPPGGTKQPSGQKLLYAWLGNDPNHP